jgi:membrane-bound serine protease (ClpP class)
MTRRLALLLAALALAAAWPARADARITRRVEVVQIDGIIDAQVQHAIYGTIRDAEREHAQLVVIQLDSEGAVGADRATDILERMRASRVPIAVWVPPNGRAANFAALIAISAHFTSLAPGARIGPIVTDDLSSGQGRNSVAMLKSLSRGGARRIPFDASIGPATAKARRVSDATATSITDVLQRVDGKSLTVATKKARPNVNPERTQIRFRKLGLIGGLLHAAAKPSITYLLLLVGLVGIVFEVFHPSTGPAGFAGLLAVGLSIYGVVTLNGSWAAFVVICFGVAAFCVDLATEHFGPLSIIGFLLLTGGSIFLFPGPFLRSSPYVTLFGVISMTMFLVGAMTRLLRDLRAFARGEREVTDPHPNGHGG